MSYDLDQLPASLLTLSNPKTVKGEKSGYLTAILHLAPASLSGRNVCSHATDGCRAACLNTAGRGGIGLDVDGLNTIQAARIRRTRFFTRDSAGFMALLGAEIAKHVHTARLHGLAPAVRLNGTSDLPWENIRYGTHANLFEAFPDVQFYDYTKVPARIRRRAIGIPNYSLTFSLADGNDSNAEDAAAAGLNVAVVFSTRKGHALPEAFMGRPVVDGDLTDLRFTDPAGVIVGLRAKGPAIRDSSGFVRAA